MATPFSTTNIKLPSQVADELVSKVADTSVIQTLSASSPAIFANRSSILRRKSSARMHRTIPPKLRQSLSTTSLRSCL